jgi:hypothetical protein
METTSISNTNGAAAKATANWKTLVDEARDEADAAYAGKRLYRRSQLDDAEAGRFDRAFREALATAGRPDLAAAFIAEAAAVGDLVTVEIQVPQFVARHPFNPEDPHNHRPWLQTETLRLPIDAALRLLAHPNGPAAELARRQGVLDEEHRRANVAAKLAAAEAAERAAKEKQRLEELERWYGLPRLSRELLLRAQAMPPAVLQRAVLVTLAEAVATAAGPEPARDHYAPKLAEDLDALVGKLAKIGAAK